MALLRRSRRTRHIRHPRHTVRTTSGVIASVVLLAGMLTGCATGERPSFGCRADALTGRDEVDQVLVRFECVAPQPFTAEYTVLTRLGDLESTATVVQTADGRRSITVNDIRFIYDGVQTATCDLSVGTCEAQINEARTSDVAVTSGFFAQAMAARLRTDADRRIADPIASTSTQAGQPDLCVDIMVTGGTKQYCALESGILARFDGSDLLIEMTSFTQTADEAAFATS